MYTTGPLIPYPLGKGFDSFLCIAKSCQWMPAGLQLPFSLIRPNLKGYFALQRVCNPRGLTFSELPWFSYKQNWNSHDHAQHRTRCAEKGSGLSVATVASYFETTMAFSLGSIISLCNVSFWGTGVECWTALGPSLQAAWAASISTPESAVCSVSWMGVEKRLEWCSSGPSLDPLAVNLNVSKESVLSSTSLAD
jgi:hypothetical protein